MPLVSRSLLILHSSVSTFIKSIFFFFFFWSGPGVVEMNKRDHLIIKIWILIVEVLKNAQIQLLGENCDIYCERPQKLPRARIRDTFSSHSQRRSV